MGAPQLISLKSKPSIPLQIDIYSYLHHDNLIFGLKLHGLEYQRISEATVSKASIVEFSLSDVLKHVMLNVFVKIQIVSYKSSTVLCSMNLYKWVYKILSNILSILNSKETGANNGANFILIGWGYSLCYIPAYAKH